MVEFSQLMRHLAFSYIPGRRTCDANVIISSYLSIPLFIVSVGSIALLLARVY